MKIKDDIFKGILTKLCDGIRLVSTDKKVLYWNKGSELITGFNKSSMEGKYCTKLHIVAEDGGKNICGTICPLLPGNKDSDVVEQKVYVRHRDGFLIPVIMGCGIIENATEDGSPVVLEILNDVSWKTKALERISELNRLSLMDPTTEVGNRRNAEIMLASKFEEFRRYGIHFGIAMLDVDDFKKINDNYGHNNGDKMLIIIAKTISGALRPFDMVCRWGGDEFIVVASNIGNEQNMSMLANRLRLLVEQSTLKVQRKSIHPTVSVGAAISKPGEDISAQLERADRFMYKSKKMGKNLVTSS